MIGAVRRGKLFSAEPNSETCKMLSETRAISNAKADVAGMPMDRDMVQSFFEMTEAGKHRDIESKAEYQVDSGVDRKRNRKLDRKLVSKKDSGWVSKGVSKLVSKRVSRKENQAGSEYNLVMDIKVTSSD